MNRRLVDLARDLGLDPESRAYIPYGHDFAKIDTVAAGEGAAHGNLVVVSAVTPTPLGEGKTVTSISLGMGLAKIGESALTCLRQPSLGPVFGAKGGGAGGGRAEVVPSDRINLGGTLTDSAGNVVVEVVIDEFGRVTRPQVVEKLDHPGLTYSTLNAMRQWKIEPATLNGEPVKVYYSLTVRFGLRN